MSATAPDQLVKPDKAAEYQARIAKALHPDPEGDAPPPERPAERQRPTAPVRVSAPIEEAPETDAGEGEGDQEPEAPAESPELIELRAKIADLEAQVAASPGHHNAALEKRVAEMEARAHAEEDRRDRNALETLEALIDQAVAASDMAEMRRLTKEEKRIELAIQERQLTRAAAKRTAEAAPTTDQNQARELRWLQENGVTRDEYAALPALDAAAIAREKHAREQAAKAGKPVPAPVPMEKRWKSVLDELRGVTAPAAEPTKKAAPRAQTLPSGAAAGGKEASKIRPDTHAVMVKLYGEKYDRAKALRIQASNDERTAPAKGARR